MKNLWIITAMIVGTTGLYADDAGTAASTVDRYAQACAYCHATPDVGAPVVGDKKIWQLIAKSGLRKVTQSVIHGTKRMPPKGTFSNYSDADVQAIVMYMFSQAGIDPFTLKD